MPPRVHALRQVDIESTGAVLRPETSFRGSWASLDSVNRATEDLAAWGHCGSTEPEAYDPCGRGRVKGESLSLVPAPGRLSDESVSAHGNLPTLTDVQVCWSQEGAMNFLLHGGKASLGGYIWWKVRRGFSLDNSSRV